MIAVSPDSSPKSQADLRADRVEFLFLNIGHFLDHFFMLIFATAAALRLSSEWGMSYAELIPYATPGFIAFGVCAIPAGWLADKWSRQGMIVVYFIGIGLSSVFAGLSSNPVQIAISLALVGIFAAIYHPVGLAMVVQGRATTGLRLAVNGVWGNLGVASAALLTAFLIDFSGWRSVFYLTGALSVAIGLAYWRFIKRRHTRLMNSEASQLASTPALQSIDSADVVRIFAIILVTTAIGGLIFQSTTFALPKVFDERLTEFASTATSTGWYAFIVFAIAAGGQVIVGKLLDHFPVKIIFSIVAILQCLLFALMIQTEGQTALIISIAFMLVVFGQIPINDVLVGRVAKSEWRSRAYALRYLVTFSVMASAVPLIAWIHAIWGFDRLFVVLSVAAGFIFLAVLFLPKATRQSAPQ